MSDGTPTERPNETHAAPPGAADAELGFDLPPAASVSRGKVVAIGAAVAVVLAGAFLAGWLPRRAAAKALAAEAKSEEHAVLRVKVVTPKAKTSDRAVTIPGSVQPLEETVVYPRASGYVRAWKTDIGDKVAEGGLLAEIETPELDQQIAQARAQLLQAQAGLAQSKANQDFSTTNLQRYKELTPKGVTSQQELDQKQAQSAVDETNVSAARAQITAQEANLQRLVQLKSFARVTAPFAGTVNARMIERGALVSSSTPLFKLSSTDTVRVFVQVPQDLATVVHADVGAKVTVREYGSRIFDGKVSRTAGSLDAASRTMNTEVRIPNPGGELMGGMYAQVSLSLPTSHRVLEVPATAVMSDAKGVRVAVVGEGNLLRLVPVLIERDVGATMELSSGLDGTERVVQLGSAELTDGRQVEVAP